MQIGRRQKETRPSQQAVSRVSWFMGFRLNLAFIIPQKPKLEYSKEGVREGENSGLFAN